MLEAEPGREGIADLGSIKSAIARPYHGYNRPLASKLAALIKSMACNHGFIDGNKRTAVVLTLVLVDRSGYRLAPLPGEDLDNAALENLVLDLVCHRLDREQVEAWFKARLRRK